MQVPPTVLNMYSRYFQSGELQGGQIKPPSRQPGYSPTADPNGWYCQVPLPSSSRSMPKSARRIRTARCSSKSDEPRAARLGEQAQRRHDGDGAGQSPMQGTCWHPEEACQQNPCSSRNVMVSGTERKYGVCCYHGAV